MAERKLRPVQLVILAVCLLAMFAGMMLSGEPIVFASGVLLGYLTTALFFAERWFREGRQEHDDKL
jgi:hypothetical protein